MAEPNGQVQTDCVYDVTNAVQSPWAGHKLLPAPTLRCKTMASQLSATGVGKGGGGCLRHERVRVQSSADSAHNSEENC